MARKAFEHKKPKWARLVEANIKRAVTARLQEAFIDEQLVDWDSVLDHIKDLAPDLQLDAALEFLGIPQEGEHSRMWEEAVDKGLVTDDFKSHENKTIVMRQGDWSIKRRVKQSPPNGFWGLDCETYKGWARLICIAPWERGSVTSMWLNMDKNGPSEDDAARIVKSLVNNHDLRSSCVVSYNMRYDAESIIKHFVPHLGKRGLQQLADFAMTEMNLEDKDYVLHYVPTKVFRISSVSRKESRNGNGNDWNHGHVFSLYDIAQFFPGMSLQKASDKYLGQSKIDDIDASRLNIDLDYWQGRETSIERYCLQDARLCARLAQYMASKVWELWKVDFKNPYSPAQTSQKLFLQRSGVMTPIRRLDVSQAIYNCFYGGRVECRMRGHFDWACLVDMKSAYIWSMVDLPDTKGEWTRIKEHSQALDHDDVPYKFVKATVLTDCADDDWGPLPVRTAAGLLVYPDGRLTGWWPWPEVQHAEDQGLLRSVQVHESVWLDPAPDNHQAPFKYLMDIYKQKESERDEARKHVIKVCGLGMYGKTAQTVDKLVPAEDDEWDAFIQDETWKRVLVPGYLFNPAIASYVTARVRMRLMDFTRTQDKHGVAVFTDSLICTRPVDIQEKHLGGWSRKDEQGTCRVLMSGMYQFEGMRPKARGIPMRGTNWDYFSLKGRAAQVNRQGPMHLHGALRRDAPELINVWVDKNKKVHPNSDRKRTWPRWMDFEEFFADSWTGDVLRVNRELRTNMRKVKV